jgi:mRNA interferase YafQ
LCYKRNLDLDLLENVIVKLAKSEILPENNYPHPLKGYKKKHNEERDLPAKAGLFAIEMHRVVLFKNKVLPHSPAGTFPRKRQFKRLSHSTKLNALPNNWKKLCVEFIFIIFAPV